MRVDDDIHVRPLVRLNVRLAVWRAYRNRNTRGQKLLDLHFMLFYDKGSSLVSADDMIEVSHPILAGVIPLGVAAGDPEQPRDQSYRTRPVPDDAVEGTD